MVIWLRFIFFFTFSMICASYVNAATNNNAINFMTYNIACLPSPLGIQINGDFVRPNLERVQEIIKVITQSNQNANNLMTPNVIAFQEAFDPFVRMTLTQQLSTYYPYNSGNAGEKALNAGSGLLLFSKYPILEASFHPYQNIMAGDEWLANKGYITAKLKYSNQYFMTVILTHLESGDAIYKDQQSFEATTSYRRGEQMGHIYSEIQTRATVAPIGYENLIYLKTFVMGDLNAPLNNEREQKSISTGMSSNGYKEGQIKYPGQNWLFTILTNTVPDNFMDVRTISNTHGVPKTVNPALQQQAIQENKFTGSTIPVTLLKSNKTNGTLITRQNSEYNVIDGMFCTKDGASGNLQSQIVSLNEYSHYKYEMSDHFAMIGTFMLPHLN